MKHLKIELIAVSLEILIIINNMRGILNQKVKTLIEESFSFKV